MKKFFFALLLGLFFCSMTVVSAQNLGTGLLDRAGTGAGYSANTSATTFSEILGTVVKAALSFVGVIFMMLTVFAGFKWMTAQGDDKKVDDAQKILRAAIIGFVLTMGAWGITSFVIPQILQRAAGTGTVNTGAGNNQCDWVLTGALDASGNQGPNRTGGTSGDVTSIAACNARCQAMATGMNATVIACVFTP